MTKTFYRRAAKNGLYDEYVNSAAYLGSLEDPTLLTYQTSALSVKNQGTTVVPVKATDLLRMIFEIQHYRSLGSNTGASQGVRERMASNPDNIVPVLTDNEFDVLDMLGRHKPSRLSSLLTFPLIAAKFDPARRQRGRINIDVSIAIESLIERHLIERDGIYLRLRETGEIALDTHRRKREREAREKVKNDRTETKRWHKASLELRRRGGSRQ